MLSRGEQLTLWPSEQELGMKGGTTDAQNFWGKDL